MVLTNDSPTVKGFGLLKRKFFGGCELDRSNQKVIVREKHEHAFLFQSPCKMILRKKAFGEMLVAGAAPSSLFIADSLLTTFREAGITGYEVVEADVRLPFPHEPGQSKYWQLIVTGWGGIANPQSGIVELDRDVYGVQKYSPCTNTRLILDLNQYDGSDLFLVWPLPYKVWVSPKLEALLAQRRVKHYELSSIASHRFELLPDDPVGFSPYPLECYFSSRRAKEVGAAHGIDWFDYTKPPYTSV